MDALVIQKQLMFALKDLMQLKKWLMIVMVMILIIKHYMNLYMNYFMEKKDEIE